MKSLINEYFLRHDERLRQQLIALLTRMVKEKTVNVITEQLPQHPYLKFRGEEYRVGEMVKAELRKMDVVFDEYARQPGRTNIIGRLGRNENGKRLLMAAHMDVVPAGDGWESDPFAVTMKDGLLYGRGVLDNKGPLVAVLLAMQALQETGLARSLAGELQIAALSDEEATDPDGIDYGIGYLLEENILTATMAIIPDIGENMRSIDIAEKGRAVIKLTTMGKQAHGSTPERGINAVLHMGRVLRELEKLELRHREHPQLGHPTLNVGEIRGGVAPNVVPGECLIYIDIRTLPGMTRQTVTEDLEGCIRRAGAEARLDVLAWSEPHEITPENDLVRSIQQSCEENLGFRPAPLGMGGGTFAKGLNLAGITAVAWGPGDDNAFHMTNEYVSLDQLMDFSRLTCLIALDLLS